MATLLDLANRARRIIADAEAAGVEIDDGNVVDLLADNLPEIPLLELRHALVVAGLGKRFPNATSRHP